MTSSRGGAPTAPAQRNGLLQLPANITESARAFEEAAASPRERRPDSVYDHDRPEPTPRTDGRMDLP